MRTYHLCFDDQAARRRIAFEAESPDHALHIAEREADGTFAELWDGDMLLARMTKAATNLWKLHPCQAAKTDTRFRSGRERLFAKQPDTPRGGGRGFLSNMG